MIPMTCCYGHADVSIGMGEKREREKDSIRVFRDRIADSSDKMQINLLCAVVTLREDFYVCVIGKCVCLWIFEVCRLGKSNDNEI